MVDKTALKRLDEIDDSFDKVAEDFREFLRSQGYPHAILWIRPKDVIVSEKTLHVRLSNLSNQVQVKRAFDSAMGRGLGVLLAALCVTTGATCCYLWTPRDEDEAMRHLMPRKPKFSVPAASRNGIVVTNPVKWFWLKWKYRKIQEFKNFP
jgi:hypothetical protein